MHTNEDPERLSRERNLFFRLLQVGLAEDAAPYAAEVLDLLVEVTGAPVGALVGLTKQLSAAVTVTVYTAGGPALVMVTAPVPKRLIRGA